MRIILLPLLASLGIAQSLIVPATIPMCPSGQLTILTKTSNFGTGIVAKVSCLALDSSVKLDATTTPPTVKAIATGVAGVPAWKIELVSLASVAAGSTSIDITPAKPPTAGAILFWYSGGPHTAFFSGVYAFAGNPLVFPLPVNWSSTDTIFLCYQI